MKISCSLKFPLNISSGFNEQQVAIRSDNGLLSNKRQATIWTNDGLVGLAELTAVFCMITSK